jgi:hypothetical protein
MLKSENFRTPLTRAQISEFLSGLDGVAVVHEPLPTTVEVRQKFMRLKEFALPCGPPTSRCVRLTSKHVSVLGATDIPCIRGRVSAAWS